ncbi:hypothetical protein VTL71DRAFT_4352 [Oculimacula yallundae]|uniref:Uncharacterized protein n=1 Tax=Oculimacula yallundae TaxID=86028 RepID=A0ABR4C1S6_9HELO
MTAGLSLPPAAATATAPTSDGSLPVSLPRNPQCENGIYFANAWYHAATKTSSGLLPCSLGPLAPSPDAKILR